MNTKILVTGSEGQLAKTIKELVVINKYNYEFVFVSKSDLDITNSKDVLDLFINGGFNYCINCAAYTNVEQAEKTPQIAYAVNADGVNNLAIACKKTNAILIHISTDYVFNGEKNKPYSPRDITNPINEYGKSKLLGEKHIQEVLDKYFIIRTSWLYSKKYGKNFYHSILAKAKKGETLFVTDAETGCPTNTENLANYILELIHSKSQNFEILHFCDQKIMTWYEFAKKILTDNELLKKTKFFKTKNYTTFAKRPKYSVLVKPEA
ncbi:dTDP-4-dehydrorhamnose reductase [Postechiella marina]|uniref:dTDP-4-dehydrorhamnose reductase n=1 Tax=Postechiella marina TaxID=943941 RepID=A0ABP8C5R1_9FLAO